MKVTPAELEEMRLRRSLQDYEKLFDGLLEDGEVKVVDEDEEDED